MPPITQRCDVIFGDGRMCTKDYGHWTPQNQDPHTPPPPPGATLRQRIAAALSEAGAFCGQCGFQPGETGCPDCVRVRQAYAEALLPLFPADPWPTITRLTAWLDNRNGRSTTETTLRVFKLQEEVGEVAQAWVGMLGQNPRKGITHTAADVADELCDVITAAMVALATITTDPAAHFTRKVQQIAALRLTDQIDNAPNPPYDLPTGAPSWGDWAGA